MKPNFPILICLVLCVLYACEAPKKKAPPLFVIAGQSNAVGQGEKSQSPHLVKNQSFEYDSNKDQFVPLNDPVGQNDMGFQSANSGSFVPALAKNLQEKLEKKLYFVQTAKGGSSLLAETELHNWGNWGPKGNLFEQSVAKIEEALGEKPLHLEAIFWSQGENEGRGLFTGIISSHDYKKALKNLVERYHEKFGGTIPFIIVQTGNFKGPPKKNKAYLKIGKLQAEVAQNLEYVYIGYSKTDGFMRKGWLIDSVHYNQKALNHIGKNLAEFYLQLIH